MEQIVDQASQLREFFNRPGGTQVDPVVVGSVYNSPGPGLPPSRRSHHPPPASAYSPGSAFGDNSAHQQDADEYRSGSTKRKSEDEDNSAKQLRSKRNRYISIACNECKRRKIKCNGETPCMRCGNLNLQCLYAPNCCSNNFKDSDDFKQVTDQVSRLQEQVDSLNRNLTALRQETFRLAPIQERILPLPASATAVTSSPSTTSVRSLPRPQFAGARIPSSAFSGPTSINFTVDMAKNTLHNMGYCNAGDRHDEAGGPVVESAAQSPTLNPIVAPPLSPARRPIDPLWDYDKNEMIRLCQVHEEEVGIMYPVVEISAVIEHADLLSTWMEAAKKNDMVPPYGQGEGISDLETCTLKIVLCCALVMEEHGCSARADQLYESIRPIVDRLLMSEPADVNNLPFLALVAGYRFLSNEEVLAWRVIGQVCRLCLELGLHRREGLAKITDDLSRRNALMSFWSAYVLDRRWSFGTGLPYVCDDDNIDPKLPMPDSHPYLVAMIAYSRLAAKIWRLVDYFEPAVIRELQRKDFDQLDSEIQAWYETVPENIKLASLNNVVPMPAGPGYDSKLERSQIWTRLRLNQIRIWLHTPVLHSASSIAENMPLAQRAVDLAKETIRYMHKMNMTTNLYRRNQVFYHQFLTSAIAVLFLASTHAPLQFSSQCRTEFYMALELIKDMSARSWVSQRLWRTVRSLKAYAPRLGLGEDDQRSGAAMTMAGLATGTLPRTGSGSGSPAPTLPAPTSWSRTSSFSAGHNGGSSPGTVAQGQQTSGGVAGEEQNGLSLKREMSAVFEGFVGRRKTVPGPLKHLHPGIPVALGGGKVVSPSGVDGVEGVYTVIKDLF